MSELILLDFTYNGTLYNLSVDKPFSNGQLAVEYHNTRIKPITFTFKLAISEAITYCRNKYLHSSKIIEEYSMSVGEDPLSEPQARLRFNFIDAHSNCISRCSS